MGLIIERRNKMIETDMITVVIPLERYTDLIVKESQLKALKTTIVNTATLSWSKDKLSFDDEAIGNMLDVFEAGILEEKLIELQNEAIAEAEAKKREGE